MKAHSLEFPWSGRPTSSTFIANACRLTLNCRLFDTHFDFLLVYTHTFYPGTTISFFPNIHVVTGNHLCQVLVLQKPCCISWNLPWTFTIIQNDCQDPSLTPSLRTLSHLAAALHRPPQRILRPIALLNIPLLHSNTAPLCATE